MREWAKTKPKNKILNAEEELSMVNRRTKALSVGFGFSVEERLAGWGSGEPQVREKVSMVWSATEWMFSYCVGRYVL